VSSTQPIPRRANTIGIYLFLASLAVLFFASMLGYVVIRVQGEDPSFGALKLPNVLWLSTLLMLAASYTIHCALLAIRRERHETFRTYLTATLAFAALFVVVQTPAMVDLYKKQQVLVAQRSAAAEQIKVVPAHTPNLDADEAYKVPRSRPFYALVMMLILVHALHVVGGMVSLGIVAYNGYRRKYDHEHHAGVRNCVLYWHFLDAVWIIMFSVIAAFG
jgi:heme/copper-type cytochrome/quinol oxidase subunit 3